MIFLAYLGIYLLIVILALIAIRPKHVHYFDEPVKSYDQDVDRYTYYLMCPCGCAMRLDDSDPMVIYGEHNFRQIKFKNETEPGTDQRGNQGVA